MLQLFMVFIVLVVLPLLLIAVGRYMLMGLVAFLIIIVALKLVKIARGA